MDKSSKRVEMTVGSGIAIEVGETSHEAPSNCCYIYKVPVKFKSDDEKNRYEPRVVSIGPYHHSNKGLEITTKHKERYLQDLISRGDKKTDASVFVKAITKVDFVKAITEVVNDVCSCYAEPIDYPCKEFIEMMVLDGCFVLELLFKFSERITGKKNQQTNTKDPVFDSSWMVFSLRRDLVLLENQLPFIVLMKLFELSNYSNPGNYSLSGFVTIFFNPIFPTVQDAPNDSTFKWHHILDLLRSHLICQVPHVNPAGNHLVSNTISHTDPVDGGHYWEYTHSATDLWESGVTFKKKESSNRLLDVTFTEHGWWKRGILEIPPFYFGESWTVLLPNLIALEQCRSDYKDEVTSYVILIDSLIDSPNDVKLLRNEEIIKEMYHEDEKVASEINNLVKEVFVDQFCYDELCRRVNKYCKRSYSKGRATLKHNYFDTPCKSISFIAAAVLLLLTVAQTTFAVLAYFRPPPSDFRPPPSD